MSIQPSKPNIRRPFRDEVSPDSLMSDFRGSSFVAIVAFTVVVHVVLIGFTSYGYLKNQVFGEDTSAMSEEERMEVAVREATSSLRDIAERHGISPQELSDRFASGSPAKSTPEKQSASGNEETPTDGDNATPEEPQSPIERELQEKKDGPELPDLPPIEEEEDLF